MEELTQFEFDEEFEQKLLAFFVRGKDFFNKNSQHMKSSYFVSKIRGDIYHLSSEYVKKYGELISQVDLKNEIKDMYLSKKKKDIPIDTYWELVDNLFTRDLSGEAYAEDQVLAFARGQEMATALKDGAVRLNKGERDLSPILTNVEKALKIGRKIPKIRTCNDVDETASSEAEDWIVRGLIAKHDINLWYAPPGCGKSHLIWFVGNATNDGKQFLDIEARQTPVTYLDLENTEGIRGHFKRLLGGGGMGLITLDEDVAIPNIDSAPEKFEEFILTLPQGVVVIDTFPMVTGETKFAESKWEVDPIIKTLRHLCAKGYTFVLIFHTLKGDQTIIKGPQELLGRCGHVVSIYSVPEAGVTEEAKELDTADPNKPKILFVGTGPNLKTRHKKYQYWLIADFNEAPPWIDEIDGYVGYSGYAGAGFKRISSPSEPVLEKIHVGLVDHLKNKETAENLNDYYPNQGEFVELITNLLECSEKQARKYVKLGVTGKFWGEKTVGKTRRYYPR